MKTDLLSWVREQWDRCAAWVCVAAGVLMLILGWVGVSDTPYTAQQIPYLASNGLGGIFLLGLGAMLWLSADLRDEWRKLDSIEGAIREQGTAVLPELRANAARPTVTAPVAAPTNGSIAAYR